MQIYEKFRLAHELPQTKSAIQLAHPGKRFQGEFIDDLAACLLGITAFFLSDFFTGREYAVYLGFAIALLYLLLKDALPNGQSIGKRLLNIRVIHKETMHPCTVFQSFLRNVTLVSGPFDWAFIFFGSHRRVGDFIASTIVVKNDRINVRPPKTSWQIKQLNNKGFARRQIMNNKYIIGIAAAAVIISILYVGYKQNRENEFKKSIEEKLSEDYKGLKVNVIDLDRKDGRVSVTYAGETCMIEFSYISDTTNFSWQTQPMQLACLAIAKINQENKQIELEEKNNTIIEEEARQAKISDEINSFNSMADKMYVEASAEDKKLLDFFKVEKEWVNPAYFCGSGGCDEQSQQYEQNLETNGWSFVYARDQKSYSIKRDAAAFTYGRWMKK